MLIFNINGVKDRINQIRESLSYKANKEEKGKDASEGAKLEKAKD